jgi:uncharacterized Zn finger protein (UPF0148 family)
MKVAVKGLAIKEGTSRNKVHYSAEELAKFAPTMAGVPILMDHNGNTLSSVGKVTKAESTDNGQTVMYEGWIKNYGDAQVVERAKDGILQVSIGAIAGRMVKESKDSDIVIAKDLQALELSLTPTPGVPGTTLIVKKENYDLNEEEISKMIEDYTKEEEGKTVCKDCGMKMKKNEEGKLFCPDCKKNESYSTSNEEDNHNIERRIKMEANEVKKNDSVVETKVDESVELKAKLEAAEKALSEMKEAQRQETITSYKAKCTEKSLTALDVSNMTMESIKALIATVDSIPAKKEEVKEVAQTKSVEVVAEKVDEKFNDYIVESSTLGGLAFGKF